MRTERVFLPGTTPGLTYELVLHHFGQPGAKPKTYIQAGLHADETPGHLCAHHLCQRLEALEARGEVRGHIVLVPVANPIGLAQNHLGTHIGRFSLSDGVNFNRDFPELTEPALAALQGMISNDCDANRACIEKALFEALDAVPTNKPEQHLKALLLRHAISADTVLDLHCDAEAILHLYTLDAQAEAFLPLAARLGAEALLTAINSGGSPFDEAITRPWEAIAAAFPLHPLPAPSIATTVELRGERDVDHRLAAADADAIIGFLADRQQLNIASSERPPMRCKPTPLAGSEALEAPVAGIIVFHARPGDVLSPGMVLAEIIDPHTNEVTPVRATTSGVLFARNSARFAYPGMRLGKIAGEVPYRHGKLLSP